MVGTVTADPATVEVVGPASAVAALTEAITEPVSIAGASDRSTETVNVGVADPSVRLRSPKRRRHRDSDHRRAGRVGRAGVPVRS